MEADGPTRCWITSMQGQPDLGPLPLPARDRARRAAHGEDLDGNADQNDLGSARLRSARRAQHPGGRGGDTLSVKGPDLRSRARRAAGPGRWVDRGSRAPGAAGWTDRVATGAHHREPGPRGADADDRVQI